MRYQAIALLMCLFPSLAFCQPIQVTDQSIKLKSSPTDVSIALGDYQTFNFDLTKPFKVITEPADAKVIKDSSGKSVHVLGYANGPSEVWIYCIVDNDFFFRCLVRIEKGKPGPVPPKPSPYLDKLTQAYTLDAGKPSDMKALAAIYQKSVDNFDAYPNLKTFWDWLTQQYATLPQSLALTRSALASIQEEQLKKYEHEQRFTVESRKACRVVIADLLSALLQLAGGSEPAPPTPPAPKASQVWAIIVEETEQRTPSVAQIVTDVAWWKSLEPKVAYRSYDKDQAPPSYTAKIIEKGINSGTGNWKPALLILEKGTGKTLDVRALPANRDEIKSIIQGIVGP